MKIFEDYLMYILIEKHRMLYNRWLRPVSSGELKKGAELVLRLMAERQVELWLLDASCCNTPGRDDQEWVVGRIGKLLTGKRARLRKLALVKSNDVFYGVVAEWMREKLHKLHGGSLRMQCFDSMTDAHSWLQEGAAASTATNALTTDGELGHEREV
ncbi:hypothetical protein [Pontibacter mangrovi]|uniref:STAS/SEC14 domain-containing protein n=1 Tax=Pontibacter mangrovi TaxID=2589816 RepID=A0A501VYE6_9BACT|nr:hypothetical protein [Pontibacter mangrovi]TPE42429.1 hypothetical protein FJM65_18580 [Pontibacter mangrovi]